jgi:hypothetical protein
MNELFLELACSDLHDPRFSSEQFGRQPVRHILKAVEFVRKREKRLANNLSASTSRLAEIVAAFASQGKSQLEAWKVLPFPEEREGVQADNGAPRITAAAAQSIRACIRDRTLPLDVIVAIKPDLDRADQL